MTRESSVALPLSQSNFLDARVRGHDGVAFFRVFRCQWSVSGTVVVVVIVIGVFRERPKTITTTITTTKPPKAVIPGLDPAIQHMLPLFQPQLPGPVFAAVSPFDEVVRFGPSCRRKVAFPWDNGMKLYEIPAFAGMTA